MAEPIPTEELEFLLFDWLRTQELFERDRFADHDREEVTELLRVAGRIAEQHFAPHSRAADLEEPTWDGSAVRLHEAVEPALRRLFDAGFVAAPLDEEVGGLQLPLSAQQAAMAPFYAANVGTTAYAMLTAAAANMLAHHGGAELAERFVAPMVEGRFFGTMALSEPHAGSNLADIRTRAERQPDGTYRIFGRKMWMSGGDHEMGENIVHMVLARTPDAPAGTKGISLFLVPKHLVAADGSVGERNDVSLAGINHKMGFRGTVNTAPVFGDGAFTPGGAPGAVGYLVGTEHGGLRIMFAMMNEARIGVGLTASALAYAGFRDSLAYARERLQGRPRTVDVTEPQVPIVDYPDVRRMLLAQKAYAEGSLALVLLTARFADDAATAPDEAAAAEAAALLGLLTPIAKSWPSEWGLRANELAIQVLGGAGYTRDHAVEQHYRDNRLNAIHEGTTGIQGQDLLGRKVLGDGGAALRLLADRVRATARRAEAAGDETAAHAGRLTDALDRLVEVSGFLGGLDPEAALADATTYLHAAGHVVLAWIWLDLWLATGDRDDTLARGKRAAARWFLARELPTTRVWLDQLTDADRLTLDLDPDVL